MLNLKTHNSKVRNIELIQTYYSNKKAQDKQILLHKQLAIAAALAILIACISYYGWVKIRNVNENSQIINLFPSKYFGALSYYDYGQIENSDAALALGAGGNGAIIYFKDAMDLTNASLSFAAKGKNGKEKLAIILKDKYNISNANPDDAIITPRLLSNKWQTFKIDLENTNLPLNKAKITQIRFDASAKLTNNGSGASVYIKNINIDLKNKGEDL